MFCKERNSQSYDSVDQQGVFPSTASDIEKPASKESSRQETSSAPSLRMWSDPAKSTNPKISALVDAIVNEEPAMSDIKKPVNKDTTPTTSLESLSIPPAPKKKALTSNTMCFSKNKLFPVKKTLPRVDLSAKFDDDDDDDDSDDDNDSGIEPMDMTARQFEDDDENEDEDDEDDDDEDDDNDQLSYEKSPIITFRNLSEEIKIIIKKFFFL